MLSGGGGFVFVFVFALFGGFVFVFALFALFALQVLLLDTNVLLHKLWVVKVKWRCYYCIIIQLLRFFTSQEEPT